MPNSLPSDDQRKSLTLRNRIEQPNPCRKVVFSCSHCDLCFAISGLADVWNSKPETAVTVGLVLAVPILLSAGGARARPEAAASNITRGDDRWTNGERSQMSFSRCHRKTGLMGSSENATRRSIIIFRFSQRHTFILNNPNIRNRPQAAEALLPIAGEFAFALFAIRIIGTGMLAVPILAGSAAYAVSESFGWVEGLDRKPRKAKAFYATIAVATIAGLTLNYAGIDPIKALYWAAVVNGLLAAPLMVVMMLIATNPKVMGRLAVRGRLAVGGWIATLVMGLVALGFFLI
jgi:Natural resistance-associated macrophage protein